MTTATSPLSVEKQLAVQAGNHATTIVTALAATPGYFGSPGWQPNLTTIFEAMFDASFKKMCAAKCNDGTPKPVPG